MNLIEDFKKGTVVTEGNNQTPVAAPDVSLADIAGAEIVPELSAAPAEESIHEKIAKVFTPKPDLMGDLSISPVVPAVKAIAGEAVKDIRGIEKEQPLTPEKIARAENTKRLSEITGLDASEVDKHYDDFARMSKITGIEAMTPSNQEYFNGLLMGGIGLQLAGIEVPLLVGAAALKEYSNAQFAVHALKTGAGFFSFMALDKMAPAEKFISPYASDTEKAAIHAVDFIVKGMVAEALIKAPTDLWKKTSYYKMRQLTKAQTVEFTPEQLAKVKEIYGEPEASITQAEVEGKAEEIKLEPTAEVKPTILGQDPDKIDEAIKNGVGIKVPVEDLVEEAVKSKAKRKEPTTGPRAKKVRTFDEEGVAGIGGLIDDIGSMEALRRREEIDPSAPIGEQGTGESMIVGYVPDYLKNIGVTKAGDLPILEKAKKGEPLTEKQYTRILDLLEKWADNQARIYGEDQRSNSAEISEPEATEGIRVANQDEPVTESQELPPGASDFAFGANAEEPKPLTPEEQKLVEGKRVPEGTGLSAPIPGDLFQETGELFKPKEPKTKWEKVKDVLGVEDVPEIISKGDEIEVKGEEPSKKSEDEQIKEVSETLKKNYPTVDTWTPEIEQLKEELSAVTKAKHAILDKETMTPRDKDLLEKLAGREDKLSARLEAAQEKARIPLSEALKGKRTPQSGISFEVENWPNGRINITAKSEKGKSNTAYDISKNGKTIDVLTIKTDENSQRSGLASSILDEIIRRNPKAENLRFELVSESGREFVNGYARKRGYEVSASSADPDYTIIKIKPGADKGITVQHFTIPENVQSILKEGFDATRPPVFGVKGREAGPATRKFGEGVLYFTTDARRWKTAEVYVGEGKGNISRDAYDYDKQTWVTEKNAYKKVDLSPVEATIKPTAKILTVDNIKTIKEIMAQHPFDPKGEGFDGYNYMDILMKHAKENGYDVLNVRRGGASNWVEMDEQGVAIRDDGGQFDQYDRITGAGGNDDYFILNKDVIDIKGQIPGAVAAGIAPENKEKPASVIGEKKLKKYTLQEMSDGTFRRVYPDGRIEAQPSASLPTKGKLKDESGSVALPQELLDLADALGENIEEVKKIFAAATVDERSRMTADIARRLMAEYARRIDIEKVALAKARKLLSKKEYRISKGSKGAEAVDLFETGAKQSDPKLQPIFDYMYNQNMKRLKEIQRFGKLQEFYEYYFGRKWKDAKKAKEVWDLFQQKTPIQGSKGFLKERTHDTMKEGLDAGLVPAYDNIVDMYLFKLAEMDRFLFGKNFQKELMVNKLDMVFPAREKGPSGWKKVEGPEGVVYGNPNVVFNEYFDATQRQGLQAVIDALKIRHERKLKLGGPALGYASRLGGIETKFGGPASVIAHELGHMIDFIYGLREKMFGEKEKPMSDFILDKMIGKAEREGRTEDVTRMKEQLIRNKELRDLADLQGLGKKGRKSVEKMAVMLEALIHAPDEFKRVAPNTYDYFTKFLKSEKELAPLLDIKTSLLIQGDARSKRAGELVVNGYHWQPPSVANLYSSITSKGLQGHPAFDFYRGAGNTINQFQLSGLFHLWFTSLDATISKVAIGMEKISGGKIAAGAKDILTAPAAPITNLLHGDDARNAWYGKASSPEGKLTAQMGVIAGARASMDQFYATHAYETMSQAFREGRPLKGLFSALFVPLELITQPVLQEIVPRQKWGVFHDLVAWELEKNPNMSETELARSMGRAWDSVDNRMGQLVYDNLFWHKATKDLLMVSVRSVGWNLGTLREIGGGVGDLAKMITNAATGKKAEFTHRTAYTMALPMVVGLYGAMYQYLMTGEAPQSIEDYFFPRNGKLDEHGKPARVALPSYVKDLYHYAKDPAQTVKNKFAPQNAMVVQMLQNKDFYGTKINNEDDPLIVRMLDELGFVASQAVPFSIRNIQKRGFSPETLLSLTTPAPYDLEMTPAEKKAMEYARAKIPVGARTKEKAQEAKFKADLRNKIMKDKDYEPLNKAVDEGKISQREANIISKQAEQTTLERYLDHLTFEETTKLLKVANPKEKEAIQDAIDKKFRNKMKSGFLSDEQREKVEKVYNEVFNAKDAA